MKTNLAIGITIVCFLSGQSLKGQNNNASTTSSVIEKLNKPTDNQNSGWWLMGKDINYSKILSFSPGGVIGFLTGTREYGYELSGFDKEGKTRSLILIVHSNISLQGWFEHLIVSVKSEPIRIEIDEKTGEITLSPPYPQGSATHHCWTLGAIEAGFSVTRESERGFLIKMESYYKNNSRGKHGGYQTNCFSLNKKQFKK